MKHLAIYGNLSQPSRRLNAIVNFFKLLDESDYRVTVERQFYEYLKLLAGDMPRFDTFAEECPECDIAVSMGGDGTFLSTARSLGASGTPIVGVNTGHLGYLADVDVADATRLLEALASGDYREERRAVLQASIVDGEGEIPAGEFALNEIAILRAETASMIEVMTAIDGEPLAHFRGDGLIVSTPTGSTGYNLSVGGPIIEPSSPALSIAPIAPHSLTMRPLVVADSTVIDISVGSRVPSWRLSFDGHWVTLPINTRVQIKRAPFTINIIHTAGHTFASTLRTKLLWGAASF